MSQTILKNDDLDLGLKGKIGLDTLKVCVIPCESDNI